MPLWKSIPFACVMLPLGSAAVTSALKGRWARRWALTVLTLLTALSALFLVRMLQEGGSYTYMMGHFPAPWGNELRAGPLEALTALGFALVMLLSLLGGWRKLEEHILSDKLNLYCAVLLLMCSALMAQVYTNDIFTAYVFVEIMTIAAGALIASRKHGRSLVAATRYMIMNMIGSALFLLGVILLYDLTGHLLMSPIRGAVEALGVSGQYHMPLTVVIALLCSGLSIKSALFPFHTWVADAYGYATRTSAAILSSLVSKGYIFLLMKIFMRVIGPEEIASAQVNHVLFVFGAVGMIMGSVLAIRQTDIRRMIACSSIAQIGYIYLGIGLGTQAGMAAAGFHLLSHALCKAMLFIAAGVLIDYSRAGKTLEELRGSGRRCPLAGAAFTVGALWMVGFPFTGGFPAKMNLAMASIEYGGVHMAVALTALVLSTLLNIVYFLRAMMVIWSLPLKVKKPKRIAPRGKFCWISLAVFALLNIAMGIWSAPVMRWITLGLQSFG